jgi:hypothetical protein
MRVDLDDDLFTPPPIAPSFCFPLEPEYRQHLVRNAAPAGP